MANPQKHLTTTTTLTTYLPFLPFLLLLLPIPLQLPTPTPTPPPQTKNYIIRFADYRLAADHRAYLESASSSSLPPSNSWRWVERRNPAVAFPTDFAVVEIEIASADAVVAAIERLPRVKDVHVDFSYSRSLFVDKGGGGGKRRGAGKMFTSMSFEKGKDGEEDDEELVCAATTNSSISWRRKLMTMQVL